MVTTSGFTRVRGFCMILYMYTHIFNYNKGTLFRGYQIVETYP